MEEFCEARANKRREGDILFRIKEMHTHMRETKLKEEEEELQQREEALKNGRKNWGYGRNNWRSVKRNVLCHFIAHSW
jgi:hypothetical protein